MGELCREEHHREEHHHRRQAVEDVGQKVGVIAGEDEAERQLLFGEVVHLFGHIHHNDDDGDQQHQEEEGEQEVAGDVPVQLADAHGPARCDA